MSLVTYVVWAWDSFKSSFLFISFNPWPIFLQSYLKSSRIMRLPWNHCHSLHLFAPSGNQTKNDNQTAVLPFRWMPAFDYFVCRETHGIPMIKGVSGRVLTDCGLIEIIFMMPCKSLIKSQFYLFPCAYTAWIWTVTDSACIALLLLSHSSFLKNLQSIFLTCTWQLILQYIDHFSLT